MTSTRGFLLGKFLPPHAGHLLLCDFARAYCDMLTILVCSLDREPIDGKLRHAWMQELFPDCRVQHLDRDIPQEPAEHRDFWNIWRNAVQEFHPEPIDFVFASESYGHRLAAEVGARFIPCDIKRLAAPISATQVRSDPFSHWSYLPAPVRAHFSKTICIFGPESSGKTTLAHALASALDTICVPEYGRTYTEEFGVDIAETDLQLIAAGHNSLARSAKRQANRFLVCDTDSVLTCVWSEMLLGQRSPAVEAIAQPSDYYFLTDIDFDWVDDGTRYFADFEARRRFFQTCKDELTRRGLPFSVLSGSPNARLEQALATIRALFYVPFDHAHAP